MEILVIILVIAALIGIIIFTKVGMMYLSSIKSQTGYNPLGFLNILLIIAFFATVILAVSYGYIFLLGTIASLVIIFIRNKKALGTGKAIKVTIVQLIAPILMLIGIIYKRSGGIMGNAAMQSNLNEYTIPAPDKKMQVNQTYTPTDEANAQSLGYSSAAEFEQKTGQSITTIPDDYAKG